MLLHLDLGPVSLIRSPPRPTSCYYGTPPIYHKKAVVYLNAGITLMDPHSNPVAQAITLEPTVGAYCLGAVTSVG